MPTKCMSYSELSNIIDIDKVNNLIKNGANQIDDLTKVINTRTTADGRKVSQFRVDELTKKFNEAKDNCLYAKDRVENSEKNLLVYEKGENQYDDIMLERYKKQASGLKRKMMETENDKINEIETKKNWYKQKEIYYNNTNILLEKYINENRRLEKNFKSQVNEIELNDRKTYYEDEQNDYAEWWAKFFKKRYFYFVIFFILFFLFKVGYKDKKYVIIAVFLLIYPFAVKYMISLIYNIYMFFYNRFKNVYLGDEI